MATIVSAFSATATVATTSTAWWLKDPLDSTANVAVRVEPGPQTDRIERSTAFYPLGRARPVVISDVVTGADGAVKLVTFAPSEYTALVSLMTRQRVLLLQSPFGEQWYIRLMGDRKSQLNESTASAPYRIHDLTYLEVDTP